MRVGDYCNCDVIIINQDETPLDAVMLMRQYNVGNVVIVDNCEEDKTPLGIVTDRDIVLEIVAAEVDPSKVAVIDIVRKPLVTVSDNDDLCECTVHMKHNGVRRAPVINDRGYLVGIISTDDIIEILSEQLNDVVSLVSSQQQYEHKKLA